MRIGLFTDTYFPSTNGIVYVVEILRKNLEELGHEVWIFAPEPRVRRWLKPREKHIVRFPALEGLLFEEQLTSFFFPPRSLKKITELNLDTVIFFTPGQVGLMGAYAALQNGTLLVEQYSTDLISYVNRYPATIVAAVALMLSTPIALGAKTKELLGTTRSLGKNRDPSLTRSQDSVRLYMNILHDRCDLLVAVSQKSADQLERYHGRIPIEVVPTGVDAIPSNPKARNELRARWHAQENDVVCLYAGRLAPEKNIELLINSFQKIIKENPSSKLVLAGGFSHADTLKQIVSEQGLEKNVVFTGRVPREKLGDVYTAADIFCFPSITDTQALVINEAANAGLPLVWCDKNVNSVAVDGESGILARPNETDFVRAISTLVKDKKLREKYGTEAKNKAAALTEKAQTEKLVKVLEKYKSA